MLRFKPGADRERGDLAPRTAERRAGQPGKEGNSQKTGLWAGKHIQAPDSPLEIFVICAQGVCSFFRTPQRRQESQGKRKPQVWVWKKINPHFLGWPPGFVRVNVTGVRIPGLHSEAFTEAWRLSWYFLTFLDDNWNIETHFKNQDVQRTFLKVLVHFVPCSSIGYFFRTSFW